MKATPSSPRRHLHVATILIAAACLLGSVLASIADRPRLAFAGFAAASIFMLMAEHLLTRFRRLDRMASAARACASTSSPATQTTTQQ